MTISDVSLTELKAAVEAQIADLSIGWYPEVPPEIVERVAIFRTLATMLAGAQEGWRASKTENRLNGEIICRERFSADDEHVLILPIEEKP